MDISVKVDVGTIDGEQPRERIPAEELGKNRYRVLGSPGLAEGFASGDVLEMADPHQGDFKVVERAGNVCVQIFYDGDKELAIKEFGQRFEAVGGWLDGGNDAKDAHLLIYTIPVSAGFPAIEAAFDQLPASIKFKSWMYGNVYAEDGSPLNWWIVPAGSKESGLSWLERVRRAVSSFLAR
jgi:hypothetical protein